jgi:hypothetical protein
MARASEGEHSVALELSPDLNALTGASSGKTEYEQQPRDFFGGWYTHCVVVIYITFLVREQRWAGSQERASTLS